MNSALAMRSGRKIPSGWGSSGVSVATYSGAVQDQIVVDIRSSGAAMVGITTATTNVKMILIGIVPPESTCNLSVRGRADRLTLSGHKAGYPKSVQH